MNFKLSWIYNKKTRQTDNINYSMLAQYAKCGIYMIFPINSAPIKRKSICVPPPHHSETKDMRDRNEKKNIKIPDAWSARSYPKLGVKWPAPSSSLSSLAYLLFYSKQIFFSTRRARTNVNVSVNILINRAVFLIWIKTFCWYESV